MKFSILVYLSVLLSLPTFLHAQSSEPLVTVFLKNGQQISGRMQMSIHDNYLTLAHDSLSQTHLAYHTIKKIYFGAVPENEPAPYFTRDSTRYFHLSELGIQVGNNDYDANATFTIHTVNGYVFSPHLMAGLGLGYDAYGSVATFPVYAHVRGIIIDRKVSPYYFGSIGRSWAWATDNVSGIDYERTQGGLFVHGGLGYQINLARSAIHFAGGYKLQKTDFAYSFEGWQSETEIQEKRTIRRVTITLGYSF